jgi:phosphoribosylanthranilate isomerase
MIDGIRLKICGLTSLVDAEAADTIGADCLGFILHPESPRYLPLSQYRAMAGRLPPRRRVAVMVEPSAELIADAIAEEFHFFQIHFRHDLPVETIAAWSEAVTPDRLWLAPKLPPDEDVSPEWLPLATYFLMDTFHAGGFGGSGKTGDWAKFSRHQTKHPKKAWILAGGLNPANIGEAITQSGARFVDVNSGVEAAPGVKDPARLRDLAAAIHAARTNA